MIVTRLCEWRDRSFKIPIPHPLKRSLTLLEPVLILGLGAMIAVVIVAILTASLNELVV